MRPPRHVTRRLLAGLAVLAAPFLRALGEAVAPAIESVYPAGGRVGTEFPIEVSGTWPEWPVAVRAAVDGVTVSPGPRPGAFQVRVAASAPAGPTLLRFFTAGGAGDPVQFVLSDTPEILEPEEGQENAAAHRDDQNAPDHDQGGQDAFMKGAGGNETDVVVQALAAVERPALRPIVKNGKV